MPMQCLLDLDGVLVDFTGAVERRFPSIGKITEWNFDEHLPISKTAFWNSCDEEFWANLDWTADGREILKLVETAFDQENICLLTKPCKTRGCMDGKLRWIEKHLPAYAKDERWLIGPAKEFCTDLNRVLIDDSQTNFVNFLKGGGKAILVPRPWNYLKEFPTVLYVDMSLKTILRSSCV